MGLNQGRILPDSRWRLPGRSRPRDRAHAQPPGEECAMRPAFQACPVAVAETETAVPAACPVAVAETETAVPAACPVAVAETETAVPADLHVLPAGPSLAGEDSFALASLVASAERFIRLFHSETQAGTPDSRLRQVRREIETAGTYWHTPAELAFGARVAWRNSSRCIGRLYWRSLRVRDRREVTTASDIAAESIAHLREATNGGRIPALIRVFAPDEPDRPGPRILNSQLVRYAGYETADGTVIGDPANAALTRLACHLGWPGTGQAGRFDLLPLVVHEPGAMLTLHELPAG